MRIWLGRAGRIVLFWTFVWLVVTQVGESFHPREQERGAPQQSPEQKTVQVPGREGPEDRVADYTLWLTIFTAVLGVATIGLGAFNFLLWLETKKAGALSLSGINLARETHISERRPWVPLHLERAVQQFEGSNFGQVEIWLRSGNTGNSPAFDTVLYAELWRGLRTDVDQLFAAFVARSIVSHSLPHERFGIVFPNEAPDMGHQLLTEQPEGSAPETVSANYYIFVCLCYRSQSTQARVHHTASAHRIQTIGGDFAEDFTIPAGAEVRPTNPMNINSIG